MKNILIYIEKQLIECCECIIDDLELLNDDEYRNNKNLKNRAIHTVKEQEELLNHIKTIAKYLESEEQNNELQ